MSSAEEHDSSESSKLPLPDSVAHLVLSRMGDVALLRLRGTSRALLSLSSSEKVWSERTAALWFAKQGGQLLDRWFCVRPTFRAYYGSLRDAVRCDLSPSELASQPFWCFRFKAAAGGSWTAEDPWWRGEPAIRLQLRDDGFVVALSDARPFWGKRGQLGGKWSAKEGRHGTTVGINGHPPYVIGRHPPNWGVFIQSCWCLLTAFEMPPRGAVAELEDSALGVTAMDEVQRRAVARYNASVATWAF